VPAREQIYPDKPHELTVFAQLRTMPRDMSDVYSDERRVATFVRPKGAPAFHLDASRSDIPQSHFDDLFRVTEDPVDPTVFLTFARSNLLRLARSGTTEQRDWLRAYLAQAPASPIKSQLLAVLPPSNQQRPAKPGMVK
jgi:hypothetical protein